VLRSGFLRFHRAAEAGGYPALLVVSLVALANVVSGIALLAFFRATWSLVIALVTVAVAVGLVAGAIDAAFSDVEEPPRNAAAGATTSSTALG
jgi:hypothetical protein